VVLRVRLRCQRHTPLLQLHFPARTTHTRRAAAAVLAASLFSRCSPVIQYTVLFLAEVWVAAAVAGCQLTHGGATTLADVVQADSATLGSVNMPQVQPAHISISITSPFQHFPCIPSYCKPCDLGLYDGQQQADVANAGD
jgi:hypothetical protein